MLVHGGRASTIDFDIYVLTDDLQKVQGLFDRLRLPHSAAGEFQLKARFGGIPVDLLIADPWLGIPALRRARRRKLGRKLVRVASPEDLIVMKTISDRPIDRRDIAELRELFAKRLDERYIRKRLAAIKKALASG